MINKLTATYLFIKPTPDEYKESFANAVFNVVSANSDRIKVRKTALKLKSLFNCKQGKEDVTTKILPRDERRVISVLNSLIT